MGLARRAFRAMERDSRQRQRAAAKNGHGAGRGGHGPAGTWAGGILFALVMLGGIGSLAAKVPGATWIALGLGSAAVAMVAWLVAMANRRERGRCYVPPRRYR
jgi:hypothetical protein